ncbi:MAG: hypothetical protein JNJ84_08860 [Rhodobacteraceae bacterium]|nr:hypothetical protein [Paracoccaceae bacterium]
MDFALVTNLLLFLGAMGVTFALDSGGSSDDDDENRADSGAADQNATHLLSDGSHHDDEDSLAADRDNLAWFLTSGEVVFDQLPSNSFAMLPPPEAASEAQAATPEPDPADKAPDEDAAAPEAVASEDDLAEALHDPADDLAAEPAEPAPAATSIELAYLPALDPDTGEPLVPELTVHPTEDGTGSVVWLDGLEVARFDDLPDLTPEQISLLPEDPSAEDGPAPHDAETATDPDEAATDDPVLIEAFTPGAEQIEIAYQPATDATGAPLPPDIRVEHTQEDDEQAALVLLDGYVVARVVGSGAAQLRPADIVATPL